MSRAAGTSGTSSTTTEPSGWLADAQLEYDLSWWTQPPASLPAPDQITRGQQFQWDGKTYEVTSLTRAHYKGVQGELPFEYWDKADLLFADLRTATGEFGTVDYSEDPPLLFLGQAVEFDGPAFEKSARV